MKLSNISLAAKLWLAIGCVIALLSATLIIATILGNQVNAKQEAAVQSDMVKISQINRWVGLTETNVTRVVSGLVSSDPAVTELYKDDVPATIAEISSIQKAIEAMDLSPESKTLFARIGQERQAVLGSLGKARELKQAGNSADALAELHSGLLPAVNQYIKSLREMAALQSQESLTLKDQFQDERATTSLIARGMVIGLIALLLTGTWFLIKVIRQPLREAITVAETIASGNLSAHVDMDRGDEFGEMMRAIGHMQTQLVRLVADVRQGTDAIAHVSAEIEAGNNDLSQRTEQTAANLEETASSMQELTANVKQSADSASQANQLAASAASVARRGGEVVGQVVSTMEDINTSSRKIADIISVIDGIAFQTNILALNAAVEAARAGEQGRGFAVVASEVRSLAGRSADAAKEIKTLINTSVEKVEGGTALVAQAGETMTEIVGSVQRVTDIMGEITAAAAEQSDGINQVNSAVSQLDQMTQQNAALVEQSAAAASSMREQAQRLAQVVAVFKLDGAQHGTAGTPSLSTAPRKPLAAPPRPRQLSAPVKALAAAKPKPAAKAPAAPAAHASAKPAAKPAPKAALSASATGSKDADDWETF